MKIGELSRRTGVNDWSLRYYEKKGLIVGERLENGYRDFDDEQEDKVRAIRCLLRLGMNTAQISHLLDFEGEGFSARDPITLYEEKLKEIDEQIETLHKSRRCLEERVVRFKTTKTPLAS